MMRPPVVPLPDAELICCNFLKEHEGLGEIIEGRVSTELPGELSFPCITLSREGGTPVESHRLDEAFIGVSAWGRTKREAFLAASYARAALLDMPGYRDDEGYVTGVRDLSSLAWMPDDSHSPTIARYVFDVAVYTHP